MSDAFLNRLPLNNINIHQKLLKRDFTLADTAVPEVRLELIEVYKNTPLLAHLCEPLVDFYEGLQECHYRHIIMVERTITTKCGTGDSLGAEYLKKNSFSTCFRI